MVSLPVAEVIEVEVLDIPVRIEASGYSVLTGRLLVNGRAADDVTVVGVMPTVVAGDAVKVHGAWTDHPRFGRQFRAASYEAMLPSSTTGLQRYLGSGAVKGIREAMAARIVAHFGEQTKTILDTAPQRLMEVQGMRKAVCENITATWQDRRQEHESLSFLRSVGLGPAISVRAYRLYGVETVQRVRENPYKLVQDVPGIGFKTADLVGRHLGLAGDHPERIAAGLFHTLADASEHGGHVFVPREKLIADAATMLDVSQDLCAEGLTRLCGFGQLVRQTVNDGEDAIYLPTLYHTEVGVAKRLRGLIDRAEPLPGVADFDWDKFFQELQADKGVTLTAQQREAVQMSLSQSGISILTGGPGTGKTTTVRAVIAALEALKLSYELAAPTGRAARRLAEVTERSASTLHRLLGIGRDGTPQYDADHPLDADLLLVDEVSMLDLRLASHLLKALPASAHLLLVGDVDQLPSVGTGAVLRDMIFSGAIPVTRLDTIFRQAETSHIVTNAHKINRGEMPVLDNASQDFFLFGTDDPVRAADLVVEVVRERIPRKFGLDPLTDIQVLAPMYKGEAGVNALNQKLQAALNPPDGYKAELKLDSRLFRQGDKVIQTRNDYEKDVSNGDLGRIVAANGKERTLTVRFDEDRLVEYEADDLDNLTLAYAISVHRSQGSEFPAVVIPVLNQFYIMLQRNLLYTAITRAKKLVVLVGEKHAIRLAVKNDKIARRSSALAWRLCKG